MIARSALLFDLSSRTKLRVTGADRLRYLNGQITNDLRKATESRAVHACVLNAKGKIQAETFIHADADSFLIDSDPELREPLAARLERYVIADDVQITDVTGDFALLHMTGETAPALQQNVKIVRADRFRTNGWDLWSAAAEREALLHLLSARVEFCDSERAEVLRIERGIPRWGAELSEEILPPEVQLESTTIDYAKGCYIGQEVISRMKMSGQTSKRLCALKPAAAGELPAGSRLFTDDAERREVGWVTSAAHSERLGGQIALGFLKRGFQEPGRTVVTENGVAVAVSPLPFSEKH